MSNVMITGATGGIGLELSYKFAQEGFNILLVARNAEKLNNLKKELITKYEIEASYIVKDMSEPNAAEFIYNESVNYFDRIDILVNNVGIGVFGEFLETELDKELKMMQLNMDVLVGLTKLFGRQMRDNGSGKIMNVASTAGFLPGPFMSVYYATKAFVLSFSEAIAVEFSDYNIDVIALCPGPTKTDFFENADAEDSFLTEKMVMQTPAEVAEFGYRSLMQNNTVAIPGLTNKTLPILLRFLPRGLITYLVKRFSK